MVFDGPLAQLVEQLTLNQLVVGSIPTRPTIYPPKTSGSIQHDVKSRVKPLENQGETVRRVEARGALDSAHRCLGCCSQIFRYAIATSRAKRDPAADPRGALPPPVGGHFASITEPEGIGELLRAIDGYQGNPRTRCALRLSPLFFVRPINLRKAEWIHFLWDEAQWRIPGVLLKMKEDLIVPLPRQAMEILGELKPLTGNGRYLFPCERASSRPMSSNTVNGALRRLGYSGEEMVGHGFRAMARTVMDEVLGYRVDWIEHQLAHKVKDTNGRAYNRTAYLAGRREMMQGWADYLVRLKEGAVSSWVRAHPATVAPAGSNRSSRGGDEAAEAFGVEGHVSDLTNTQAIT